MSTFQKIFKYLQYQCIWNCTFTNYSMAVLIIYNPQLLSKVFCGKNIAQISWTEVIGGEVTL